MAEIDVLKAQIVRDNVQTPWGFRLQGGTEYGQPITIQRVTPGSPAARIGLRSGDEVTEIGDKKTRFWTHGQASNAITQYGQTMILTVERPAHGAVPQNPVISSQSPSGQPGRGYDMYDLTGASSHPRNPTYQQPQEFHRATARPFEPPSTRPQPPPAAVQPEPHYRSSPQQAYYPQYQHLEPENRQGEVRQSGTFNILASLLSNEGSMPCGCRQPAQPPPQQFADDDSSDQGQTQSRTFMILQSLMENDGEPPPPVMLARKPQPVTPSAPSVYVPAQGPGSNPRVIANRQFNSPIGLYSHDVTMDTVGDKMEALSIPEAQKPEETSSPSGPKPYIASETMRLVKQMDEEEKLYGRPNHPPSKTSKPVVGRVIEDPVPPPPTTATCPPKVLTPQQQERSSPVLSAITPDDEARRHSTGVQPKLLTEPERRFSTGVTPKQSLYRPIPKPYTPPVLTSSSTGSGSLLDRTPAPPPITSVSMTPKPSVTMTPKASVTMTPKPVSMTPKPSVTMPPNPSPASAVIRESASPTPPGSDGTPSRYMSTVVVGKNRPTIQITNDVSYRNGSEAPTMNLDVTVGDPSQGMVDPSPLYKPSDTFAAIDNGHTGTNSQPARSVVELTAKFQAPQTQTDPAPRIVNKSPQAKIEWPSNIHTAQTSHTTHVVSEAPRATINISPMSQHVKPSNGHIAGTHSGKVLQTETSSDTISAPPRASIHIPAKTEPSLPSTYSTTATLNEAPRATLHIAPKVSNDDVVSRARTTEVSLSKPPETVALNEGLMPTITIPAKFKENESQSLSSEREPPADRVTPTLKSDPSVNAPMTVTLNEPPRPTVHIPAKFHGSPSTIENDAKQAKASVVHSTFQTSTTAPNQVTINQAPRATIKISSKFTNSDSDKEEVKPKEPGKIKIPGQFTKSDSPSSSDPPRKGLRIPAKFQVHESANKKSTINVSARETTKVSPKGETPSVPLASTNSGFQPYRAPVREPRSPDAMSDDFPPPPPSESSEELAEYMPSEFPAPPPPAHFPPDTEAADWPEPPSAPNLPPPPPITDQPPQEPAKMEPKESALYHKYADLLKEEEQRGPVQSRTFNVLSSMVENEPEPPAGSSGLPPPRSAYQEQRKQEAAMARQSSPRVKVFMPQQYNTPLGMYSAQNVVETFQSQADRQLDEIESKHPDIVSGAQRAALEEDRYRAATSDL